MISIYSQNNTEYTKNGDAVLIPTRCELSLTINGAWQLTLEHPYDQEERYKYIVEGAVVQCDIKCIRELPVTKQRFRIYTYTKGLHGITAIGFPIAMEATYDAPIDNLVISGKTGAQAMAQIQTFTNKYTLSTDVTKTASASMSNTNVNSAIASGNANSFIGAWGGEILYSNYDFMVKSRLGDNVAGDHRIIYGRNLTNIEYKKDDSGLTTRIYPISEDGIRLNGTGYVDSPKISDYPIIHHRFMQAPYNLIDTDASSASATAQQTRTSLAAISTAATTLSQGVDISSYPPEYIKQQRADIVAAVQTMALNGVISTSLYNAAAKTIADAMAWMNNLAQPEWDWMGSYEAGWKYGNSDGYAVSQYVKIGKTWRYFGANGNWQEPADSSNEWDWYQSTEEAGKRYGDFSRYYAHNEYVFITLDGQLKQYWFNEEGWYEEDESGDSDYAWNGSGTAEDPWWFGESSSKYLKSCWAFIDGTYYFFDEYGYYDGSTKFDDYQWDWVDDGSRAWFGNPDHEFAAFYLTNQWCKIDGSWHYFDNDGYVYDDNAARANVISLYTTGMAALATTVSTQATALYTLLYSLMTAYAQSKFDSGVDMPYITITVNMADLSKTTEYAGYENLETVKLGDSVECIDNEHDISMTNRVIGLTYDVIRDYNSEVVLGNAASTVASIVGNANGQAVAGGFDTSAIESQLDALQNKMGDFLLNGSSIVTNGVGVMNLLPGDNISISRDGRTLTISGEGGGSNIYYGTTAPATSLGVDRDAYFQLDYGLDGVFEDISPQNHIIITNSYLDNNGFNADISGSPIGATNAFQDSIVIKMNGLESGNQYTVSCDLAISNTAEIMPVPPYSYNYIHIGNQTTLNNDDNHGFRPTYAIQQVEGYGGHYEFTFTADDEQNIHIGFDFLDLKDNVNFTATIRNLRVNIAKVTAIYCKVGNTWEKYEGGETYTAGSNIDITNNVISAPVMMGATADANGASGAVPQPLIADKDKVLKGDGTWGEAGTEVEANPSGTATATLQKVDIDGTIYEIQSGGGGGSNLILDAIRYTTTEKQVGIWIDGKPLYQKTISCGALPNATTKTVAHGISNIDFIANGWGYADNGTQLSPIPFVNNDNIGSQVVLYITHTDITLRTTVDRSTFTKTYVTIQYTKTTDAAGSGGYQAWGFSPIIYSTEEREVGVWVDNKPLYQKTTYFGEISTNANYRLTMDIGVNIVDTVIDMFANAKVSSGAWVVLPYPLPSADYAAYLDGYNKSTDKLTIKTGKARSFVEGYATIYYTKTTDVAGSGSYNTLGVPMVNFDTSEQVIGTWMGETLYQKCVATGGSVPSGATLIERTAMASTGYDTIKYIKS